MREFVVLLATGRPAVVSFFMELGQNAIAPFTVIHIPTPVGVDTLVEYATPVATATVAVVDTDPDPVAAIQLCQDLRASRPALPLAALFCCARAVTPWHLRMLFDAGVSNLLDLHATGEEVLRVLQSIARGDIVLHVQLKGEQGSVVGDLATGQELSREMGAGSLWSKTIFQLLELLVRGLTDREIGAQLNLSPHTIKHHIERVRDDVGAKNRIELAAWASRQGFYHPSAGVAPEMSSPTAALG